MMSDDNRPPDIFGKAFLSYLNGEAPESIEVWIDGEEQDPLPPAYFFRGTDEMPLLEQLALDCSRGRTLDVGAAAGCHSLVLQHAGIDVTALEISFLACEVMRKRGIKKVVQEDFFSFKDDAGYDTILLMMNGLGMGQSVEGTTRLLQKAASLLNKGGVILGDTSDISYFREERENERGLSLQPPIDHYYGMVHFQLKWNALFDEFNWIYPDPELLKNAAHEAKLTCELVSDGPHHDFLMAFTHLNDDNR